MAVGNRFALESLETRQHMTAAHPVAINFNDEALWDGNFDTAVTQSKALGVTAVRVWLGFDSYDQRPNAWDTVTAFGSPSADGSSGLVSNVGNIARSMQRVFALARDGFSVMVVVQPNNGIAPTSAAQVKGFIRHLMDATETPTSSTPLSAVVDSWEIGNEPDSGGYWAPSAVNKTTGLQSYVDNFLIPAAEELHSNPTPEKVVSAGVSYSPADLKTILDELAAKNAIADIDYAGFHPYGTFDPSNPSAGNQILDRTLQAKAIASVYGKSLIASEWNVRGFSNTGANDAQWAAAMDYEYRNVILPNYSDAYYFALVNNWAGRGGTTSARPGGLLEHASPVSVTPSSSLADLTTYYSSPLVTADPFYTTFSKWQMASVSGQVANTTSSAIPSTVAYLDANNNGVLDAGEAATTTAADGSYTLNYSIASITPGLNTIRILTPDAFIAGIDNVTADLEPLSALTGINFSITPIVSDPTSTDPTLPPVIVPLDPPVVVPPVIVIPPVVIPPVVVIPPAPVSTVGGIGGFLWNDGNGDGLVGDVETRTGSRVVFIDANRNGKLDTGEKQTTSDANGNYAFQNLAAGTYFVSRVFPTGFHLSNATTSYITVTVTAGQTATGANIGTTDKTAPVVIPPVVVTPVVIPPVVVPPVVIPPVVVPPPIVVPPVVVPPVIVPPIDVPPVVLPPIVPPVVVPPVVIPPVVVPVVVPPVVIPPVSPVKTGTATISGTIFARVGTQTKALLAAGLTAYIDSNNNGLCDAGEMTAAVNVTTGSYSFANLSAGNYTIAMAAKAGWGVYTPGTKTFVISLTAGRVKTGQNFVMQKA